jgi:hypothetical protein
MNIACKFEWASTPTAPNASVGEEERSAYISLDMTPVIISKVCYVVVRCLHCE